MRTLYLTTVNETDYSDSFETFWALDLRVRGEAGDILFFGDLK